MASINQVQKVSSDPVKITYTNRDYVNILNELINDIPTITQKWQSTDENDPGMILVKLMSIVGDLLNYQLDMTSLEVYPNSVTLRKNAASIYRLIGYKMRWYESAIVEANVVNTYANAATMPRFCTFSDVTSNIVYTTFSQYELPSNTTNNGLETTVELIQGSPVTPVRTSTSPYPETGKPWHSIYGYNYSTNDLVNNRLYLNDNNIDENHIILIDDKNEEWQLRENIYTTTDVGRFFEFGVDVNNACYLEIVDYWQNFNISQFKVFYIRSNGAAGQINANTLTKVTGNVWSRYGTEENQVVYNVNGFINFTHYASSLGYDPETPDEARKNSVKFQNTIDTLITLADFERATLRQPGVANVRATDLTNDPGMEVSYAIGNITMDTLQNINAEGQTVYSDVIDQLDVTALENYLADSTRYPLSQYQLKLADCNQDGIVDSKDLACLKAYITGDFENSGYCGIKSISDYQTLDGLVVKLYILRTEAYEDVADDVFTSEIQTALKQYKVLPLNIVVDLHSIQKYYWSVVGTFFTTQPLSRDDLQTIIININNNLRHTYSLEETNFNTAVNYRDVIQTILDTDNRILMVDLDPITYVDSQGNSVSKEQVTGYYTQTVAKLNNAQEKDNLVYDITLDHEPILPGSLLIRVNGGKYTFKDNNNGTISNIDGVLAKNGTINYIGGTIHLEFATPVTSDLIINYTHNSTNVAIYRNLSTQTFYFDPSSLLGDSTQDLI